MLKFAHKMSAGIIKFVVAVENWFVRCGGFNITDCYNVTYYISGGCEVCFGSQHIKFKLV